jgi:hypothetical protein
MDHRTRCATASANGLRWETLSSSGEDFKARSYEANAARMAWMTAA